ncbi:hypothetical protein F5884DRAFT_895869 [Xylogone sp. PMI_703]|nr:hypothetical protein F5884DRAFT_895869 [Xylogone sp. PMI_703]
MATQYKRLILAKEPVGFPVIGQDLVLETTTIDLTTPPPKDHLLIRNNYYSYDPAQRRRLQPSVKSYFPGYDLGSPICNYAISTVILSSSPLFKPGDIIIGSQHFEEYSIIRDTGSSRSPGIEGINKLDNPLGLDPKLFLGALGMSGLTAYSSFYEICKPKKGETIFISAASGAVGQVVGQLAKREGLKVLGSVGNDEKLKFIKEELGFDDGFNYKTEDVYDALKRMAPGGIDIYYDNVGGEQLDASYLALNNFGRIVSCGNVSQTSLKPEDQYRYKNVQMMIPKRLTQRGFIVTDPEFQAYAKEHQENMQKWIKNGEIAIKMSVTEGIDHAAEGLLGMLQGKNFGKAMLKLADI